MNRIKASETYDPTNEQQFREGAVLADGQNVKRGSDIIMRGGRTSSRNPHIVVYDDDGTPWVLGVSTSGTTTWTPL